MKTSLELEIEQLMKDLQKEIKEQGLSFVEEADFEEIQVQNQTSIPDGFLHYEHPLKSSKKSIRKIVLFIKRLIQSCNRFLLIPILEEQSAFNGSVKTELDRLNEMIRLQDHKIRTLERSRKEPSK